MDGTLLNNALLSAHYGPLRHPKAPGLSLTGVRLVIPDHAEGLPVLRALSTGKAPPCHGARHKRSLVYTIARAFELQVATLLQPFPRGPFDGQGVKREWQG